MDKIERYFLVTAATAFFAFVATIAWLELMPG
jgi:hypothetical protein